MTDNSDILEDSPSQPSTMAPGLEMAEAVGDFRITSGIEIIEALENLGLSASYRTRCPNYKNKQKNSYKPQFLDIPPDPGFTFDTFVVAKANSFAVDVAKRVADQQNICIHNPLFIYGEMGTGKTHLLSAMANHMGEKAKLINVIDLKLEYERAKSLGCRAEFRDWLSKPTMLLLDDIRLFEGEEWFQRELFSLLNHRIGSGRTVVISCDGPPTDLEGCGERLISRLGGGVTVELKMCETMELEEIIHRTFERESLPGEVVEYLAENMNENVRTAIFAARRLVDHKERTGKLISLDMARTIISPSEVLAYDSRSMETRNTHSAGLFGMDSVLRSGNLVSIFKEMFCAAESKEEQLAAMRIVLSEKLRQMDLEGGDPEAKKRFEKALYFLKEGKMEQAIECAEA